MKKKSLIFCFVILIAAFAAVTVFADQDAYERYCHIDHYGCWETNEEGGKDYIMFWSEEARAYFMGPDSNAVVTDYCYD